jgi:hypothetical protein
MSVRAQTIRPLTNGMRSPIVAPVTRALIGLPAFVFATRTDEFFAWTITPPLMAAFLGACYFGSVAIAVFVARERTWAEGRIGAVVALVFAPLTTAATVIHLDRFHLDNVFGWFWIVAYVLYPPMLAFLLVRQLRVPGGDPPRQTSVPVWMRAVFVAHVLLLFPIGIGLFVAPVFVGEVWPWTLTPLTGQITGVWCVSLGVIAAQALYENDMSRLRPALRSYPFFAVFQLVALARYPGDMQWGEPGAWIYLAYLASALVLGAYGVLFERRSTTKRTPSLGRSVTRGASTTL